MPFIIRACLAVVPISSRSHFCRINFSSRKSSTAEGSPLPKEMEIILKEGASAASVFLNQKMIEQFMRYLDELKEWNRVINLTSLKEDDAIIIKHFVDSLSPVPHLPLKASLLDMGSGAGFPGIPIKIARPTLAVTLLEATGKKVNFQRHLIRTLGLTGVSILQGRAERLAREKGNARNFDIVISRAFSGLEKFLRLGAPFVKNGGCLIAMKGKRAEKELRESAHTARALSLEVSKIETLPLSAAKEKRCLIFMKKK